MIKSILNEIKNIKSRSQLSKIVKDSLNLPKDSNIDEIKPHISPDVNKIEFINRYKNLAINCYVVMVIMLLSIVRMMFEDNGISIISCFLVFLIGFVFYIKLLFRSWCARKIYQNWDERFNPMEFLLMDFIDDVSIDPRCLFPVDIKRKQH